MKKRKSKYINLYPAGINYISAPSLTSEEEFKGIREAKIGAYKETGKSKGTAIGSIAGMGLGLGVSALTGGAVPPTLAMSIGSQLGSLAGGLIGQNIGLKKKETEIDREIALRKQRELSNFKRSMDDNRVVTDYLNTYTGNENRMLMSGLTGMMYPVLAQDGLLSYGGEVAELEKGEMVFTRDNNGLYRLVRDYKDSPTHGSGGVFSLLREGEIVIPKKYRKEVEQIMDSNGIIRDNLAFNNLLIKLPSRSNKIRDLGSGKVYNLENKKDLKEVANNIKRDYVSMFKDGILEKEPPEYIITRNLLSNLVSSPIYNSNLKFDNTYDLSWLYPKPPDYIQSRNLLSSSINEPIYKSNLKFDNTYDLSFLIPKSPEYIPTRNLLNDDASKISELKPSKEILKSSNLESGKSKSNLLNLKDDKISSYLPFLGMLVNTVMGLKDNSFKVGKAYAEALMAERPEVRDATYVRLDELKYNDRSQPLRNELYRMRNDLNRLAANISGGSAQNLMNIYRGNFADTINKLQSIDNQEAMRLDQINAQNVGIRNQQEMMNKQYYDTNVTYNEQNRARARDLRRLGLGTMYSLLGAKDTNLRTMMLDNLKYLSDYQYNKKTKESEDLMRNLYLQMLLSKIKP